MTISTIAVDDPITAVKFNEVIDAINDISLSWIHFNGLGGINIRGSFGNISGATRVSSGLYRINFTTPMSDEGYAVVGSCSITAGNDTGFIVLITTDVNYCEFQCRNDDGGANDCTIICLTVMGS